MNEAVSMLYYNYIKMYIQSLQYKFTYSTKLTITTYGAITEISINK